VHAATGGPSASADLTLRVPRAKVATAIERLSALGTITDERVDVQDEQATLDATARKIARLQKQLAALRAQGAPAARIAALTARIEALQRGEAATRRSASFATVRLHVATRQAVVTPRHGHGRLHGIVVALTWLGVGALYALAVGLPVVLLLAAAWLAVRVLRRRREDALLSRS
jgi:multidrug efflux pump subunit AcrA (membrane-fusion protein)